MKTLKRIRTWWRGEGLAGFALETHNLERWLVAMVPMVAVCLVTIFVCGLLGAQATP